MIKKEATKEEVEKELNKNADGVSQAQVDEALENQSKTEQIFKHVRKLGGYWEEVKWVYTLLKDYATGRYRNLPWRTIAILVAGLAYVLTPFDLVPDFIPIIGWSDDCLALAGALAFSKKDLEEYKAWKKAQDENS